MPQDSYQFYVGPAFSGSPPHYHADAWNALAHGRKRWFLYPPDDALYTSQPSYVFLEGGGMDDALAREGALRPLECVQEAGDVMFVPDFWGHMILNLRESVGIAGEWETQYWFH